MKARRCTLLGLAAAACAADTDGPVPQPPAPPVAEDGPHGNALPMDRAFACGAQDTGATPARLWRLTDDQYRNTVATVLGGRQTPLRRTLSPPSGLFPPFDVVVASDRFSTHAASYTMTDDDFASVLDAATALGNDLVSRLHRDGSCLGLAPLAGCLRQLVGDKGELMFRRPLTPAEVDKYTAIAVRAAGALGSDDAGAAVAFQAMLIAPQFLYRVEAGAGPPDARGMVRLTPFETAAALAYTLTDTPPDSQLWEAAAANRLTTPEQLAAEIARLTSPVTRDGVLQRPTLNHRTVARFVGELFPLRRVHEVFKDPKDFPFHDADALLADTEALVGDLLAAGRKTFFASLMTTQAGYASGRTADSYGLDKAGLPRDSRTRVSFAGSDRAGLLGQPAFLVAFSASDATQPVQRGRFVSESLLCREVPELPIGEIPPLSSAGPDATMRERLASHSAGTCAGCHRLMDPIGLGFEGHDHLGRPRTVEGKRPADPSGELTGAGAQDGPFRGIGELGRRLAASEVAERCLVRHSFRYWLGRDEQAADACTLSDAHQVYRLSGGDYLEVIAALLTSDSFLLRRTR